MNFVTLLDKDYFNFAEIQLKKLFSFYPQSKMTIYYLELSDDQIQILKSFHFDIDLIKWDIKLEKKFIDNFFSNNILVAENFIKKFKQLIKYILRKKSNNYSKIKLEFIFYQKIKIFETELQKDFSYTVWLDSDLFLIDKIDEVFKEDFDIAVTTRRENEFDFEINNCRLINAGFIIIKNSKNGKLFLNEWKNEAQTSRESLVEQTSLSRILEKNIGRSFFNMRNIIHAYRLHQTDIKVINLDGEIYNFNWIEEGVDINKVKIVHFKSGRKANNIPKEII